MSRRTVIAALLAAAFASMATGGAAAGQEPSEVESIFVAGEVRVSGEYSAKPGMNVRVAIALAGGVTGTASTRRTTIIRTVEEKAEARQVMNLDEVLQAGDIVFVPWRPAASVAPTRLQPQAQRNDIAVYVAGRVNKPGKWTAAPGLTVGEAVALAGGAARSGDPSQTRLYRNVDGKTMLVAVGLDTPVEHLDLVEVPRRSQ